LNINIWEKIEIEFLRGDWLQHQIPEQQNINLIELFSSWSDHQKSLEYRI
jgi:hypothetical protein